MTIIFAAGLLSLMAAGSRAAGTYKDVSDLSDFIRVPRSSGFWGSITRSDAPGRSASLFTLAGFFPVRSSFVMQLETAYVAVAEDSLVVQDFGDLFLRMKAKVWTGDRRALSLTSDIRLGTGTAAIFPYSTASTDVEMGLAFVDSLGHARADSSAAERELSYWIIAGGTYVVRNTDALKEGDLHGHNLSAGGGVVAGISRRFAIEAGGLGLFFNSGAVREIYYGRLSAALTPVTRLHAIFQAERGAEEDRAIDASAQVRLVVLY